MKEFTIKVTASVGMSQFADMLKVEEMFLEELHKLFGIDGTLFTIVVDKRNYDLED